MSENESKWFETYNGLLFKYMRTATEDGIDLCQEQDPPKFRYITVSTLRVLAVYVSIELLSEIIVLECVNMFTNHRY